MENNSLVNDIYLYCSVSKKKYCSVFVHITKQIYNI